MTHPERRKRARVALKLPVLILRPESGSRLWTETIDISNNGFYCSTSHPFAPGEVLQCLISLPSSPPSGSPDTASRLYLEAKAEVIRIAIDGSGFGVAFRILDYRVLAQDAVASWATSEPEQDDDVEHPIIEQPA